MDDFLSQSVWGSGSGDMLTNPNQLVANSSNTDVSQVLRNGIAGTLQAAMDALVGEKVQSGQLQPDYRRTTATQTGNSLLPLLLVGAVVYMLVKS